MFEMVGCAGGCLDFKESRTVGEFGLVMSTG